MSEREKLMQEFYAHGELEPNASWGGIAADLAIAYGRTRVAEAVVEVERICGEWGCNPKFTLLLTSALSPAREGGE